MDSHANSTVDVLLQRSKNVLKDWEVKKATPTPKVRTDVYPEMKEEVKKVAPAPFLSPTLEPRTGTGYDRDWDGKVKPVAVGEMAIPEEVVEVEVEVMEKSDRESLTTIVEDNPAVEEKDKKEEVGKRIELPDIISELELELELEPTPTYLVPIQEESSPAPSATPPAPKLSVPAIPSPPTRPPFKDPKPAVNTLKPPLPAPAIVQTKTVVPAPEWKPKQKLHDWFCVSHKESTSSLDPYKCIRCTKRRAEAKSSIKK